MAAPKLVALLYSQMSWAPLDLFKVHFQFPFLIENDLQQCAFKLMQLFFRRLK